MKKTLLFLLFTCTFISCIDCERLANTARHHECLLIIKKLNDSASVYNFEVYGKNLTSQKDTTYKKQIRWFCKYYKFMGKGDTIIKRKGELVFNIHKKDTILSFNWECEGKVYK